MSLHDLLGLTPNLYKFAKAYANLRADDHAGGVAVVSTSRDSASFPTTPVVSTVGISEAVARARRATDRVDLIAPLRDACGPIASEPSVALVPTMGALHAGHLALVGAPAHATRVVVSACS